MSDQLYIRKCDLRSPAACKHSEAVMGRDYTGRKFNGPKFIKVCTLPTARYMNKGKRTCQSVGKFVLIKRPGKVLKDDDTAFITVCGLKSPAKCDQIQMLPTTEHKKVEHGDKFFKTPVCKIACANRRECAYFGKTLRFYAI